jgi:RimJ/RimL family protein N-acetyltransferase
MLATHITRAVLADGRTLTVRPIQPWEAHLVDEVFERMSEQSRYARFLSPVPKMTAMMRKTLTAVDHDRHGAWVAEVDGDAVGIGRWVRYAADPERAELAFEIADEFQGVGVGTVLLRVLLAAAKRAEVARLECTVAPGNQRAIGLTRKIPNASWRWEDGLIVGSITVGVREATTSGK